MEGVSVVRLTLRPEVPMGAYHALGYVCVLGACEGLRTAGWDVGIAWPFGVADATSGRAVAQVRTTAGYDEGMFARCEVLALDEAPFQADVGLADALARAIEERVGLWASDVRAGRAKAGPLAPALGDYFDHVCLLGHAAEAVYPNGNVMARGTFVGVDVWGRATLRTVDGRELEFAPEQASLRAFS